MLLNGETDLAFFNLPVKSTNIDYEVIKHEEILVIMSVNHPLAHSGITLDNCKFPWMDLHLLKDEPFIMQVPGQRTRDTVDQLCKKMDFTPVIKLETCNIPAAVMDCLLIAGIIGTICCTVNESANQMAAAVFLLFALAGLYAHFLLNGKLYQHIWNNKLNKKRTA